MGGKQEILPSLNWLQKSVYSELRLESRVATVFIKNRRNPLHFCARQLLPFISLHKK
jgi:hypothetical protein